MGITIVMQIIELLTIEPGLSQVNCRGRIVEPNTGNCNERWFNRTCTATLREIR